MPKLRSIGLSDFAVLEGRQCIGRISVATRTYAVLSALERHRPSAWRTSPGLVQGLDTARRSSGGLGALKARTTPEQDRPRPTAAMNIRDDG